MSLNVGTSKYRLYKALICSALSFIPLAGWATDEMPKDGMNRPPIFQPKHVIPNHPGMPFHSFLPLQALPPLLNQLQLSEPQKDKLFELSIAQAPAMYEKAKSIKHFENELAKNMAVSSIDTNAVYAVVDKLAQAQADLMRIQVKNEIELRKILTPPQKEQLDRYKDDSALLFEHHRELVFGKAPPPLPRLACD